MTEKDDKDLKLEAMPDEPDSGEEKTGSVLVAQFVLVPLVIIAVCVGVFVSFSWLTGEGKTASDYLNELRRTSGDRRWQAAFELSKFVNYTQDPSIRRSMLPGMISVFQEARQTQPYDPRIRQYLALALGRIGDPIAVPALLEGVADPDIDTQLYSIWALGMAKHSSAIGPLIEASEREDPAIRKISVYVLGNYPDEAVRRRLQASLRDVSHDVRWNAALGLAKQGDSAGKDVILQIIDRSYLDQFETLSDQEKAEIMINALHGLRFLKDSSLLRPVRDLSENDPHPSVRQAAMETLDAIYSPN